MKVRELKGLLRQRKLRRGGNKAQLIDRLTAYDEQQYVYERLSVNGALTKICDNSPFCFLKLPPEIRIMIYKFAISDDNDEIAACQSDRQMHHVDKNASMIQQPNLLRSCSLVQAEALSYFFELRDFHIIIDNRCRVCLGERTLKALVRWLKRSNVVARVSMQELQVTFKGRFDKLWVLYVDYLLKRLPYSTAIRLQFMDIRDFSKIHNIWQTYQNVHSGRLPDQPESLERYWRLGHISLVFPARNDVVCPAVPKAHGNGCHGQLKHLQPNITPSEGNRGSKCGNCGSQVI